MSPYSRREFLEGSASLVAATSLPSVAGAGQAIAAAPRAPDVPRSTITVTINGTPRRMEVEDRWTLAECLRDHVGLTGTKIGCDRGECGACTVQLDDRTVYACSYLAVWADGARVETVEGLAQGDTLHPLQQAFFEHDGPQCGFCTSGQLMSARALLATTPRPTAEQVRKALVGNLCRCSNYNRYVESVLAAAAMTTPSAAPADAAGPGARGQADE